MELTRLVQDAPRLQAKEERARVQRRDKRIRQLAVTIFHRAIDHARERAARGDSNFTLGFGTKGFDKESICLNAFAEVTERVGKLLESEGLLNVKWGHNRDEPFEGFVRFSLGPEKGTTQ